GSLLFVIAQRPAKRRPPAGRVRGAWRQRRPFLAGMSLPPSQVGDRVRRHDPAAGPTRNDGASACWHVGAGPNQSLQLTGRATRSPRGVPAPAARPAAELRRSALAPLQCLLTGGWGVVSRLTALLAAADCEWPPAARKARRQALTRRGEGIVTSP